MLQKAKSEAQMYEANLLLKCEVETDDQITAKADAQMAEAGQNEISNGYGRD